MAADKTDLLYGELRPCARDVACADARSNRLGLPMPRDDRKRFDAQATAPDRAAGTSPGPWRGTADSPPAHDGLIGIGGNAAADAAGKQTGRRHVGNGSPAMVRWHRLISAGHVCPSRVGQW